MVVRFGLQLKPGYEFQVERLLGSGNRVSRRPAAEHLVMLFLAENCAVSSAAFPSFINVHCKNRRRMQVHGTKMFVSFPELRSASGLDAKGRIGARHCACANSSSREQAAQQIWEVGGRQGLNCGGCKDGRGVAADFSFACGFPSLRRADRKVSRVFSARGNGLHTASRKEGRYISIPVEENEVPGKRLEVEVSAVRELVRGEGILSKSSVCSEESESNPKEVLVVNFYHFVRLEEPHEEVARHASFLKGKDIRGRIYISEQGINAQLSGPKEQALEYAEWVKADSRFAHVLVQTSPSQIGHTFPRLRLRYKPSLVQVEGGTEHLPIIDPSARAVRLTPREWCEKLDGASVTGEEHAKAVSGEERAKAVSGKEDAKALESPKFQEEKERGDTAASTPKRPVVLLDVRNGYEWDVGHFNGAQRPNVDSFKTTGFGLAENEPAENDPLANVDKEAVDVMMYCTGGIRCDVFSTILRKQGFTNLYTLQGGVSNFLKEEGPKGWAGSLFVFDSRLAVSPAALSKNESHQEAADFKIDTERALGGTNMFARCRSCGESISEPRHRNCANLDCNLLYLSCEDCVLQQRGCCSDSCSNAPKVRPLLAVSQYDRWHNYRPVEPKPPKPADYISRRALKRRRRKERRKQRMEQTVLEDWEESVG